MNKLPAYISLSNYFYELKDEKIAKFPLEKRDHSKLLLYENEEISHHTFHEIGEVLPTGSNLVFNNSKVVPARIYFKKESGTLVEIFLLEPYESEYHSVFNSVDKVVFKCLIGNKKRWKNGELTLELDSNYFLKAKWLDRESNIIELEWNKPINFYELLAEVGELPLPPYLNRKAELSDHQTYQTQYATQPGAVAAPTAGLHFTEEVLQNLQNRKIGTRYMTLHVSAGTFMPVTAENVLEHNMHQEIFYFNEEDIHFLFGNNNIVAVGTTSLRMVESLYWIGERLLAKEKEPMYLATFYPYNKPKSNFNEVKNALLEYCRLQPDKSIRASTSLMIVPGYTPSICRGIVTNFHQPSSTLLMLISALVGDENRKRIYQEALTKDYRFLSYGDSSLLIW